MKGQMNMTERQLATIRKVVEIRPIDGADKIEAVRVDGWWVVAKKGEFKVGDLGLYFEIDSWVPNDIAPFLTPAGKESKEYEGIKGERLRTVRLKGQISQGLLLPVEHTDSSTVKVTRSDGAWREVHEGDDLTDFLGILKWEKPVPATLAGQVKGNFPSFIPKTDQPRIQNLTQSLDQWHKTEQRWEVTEKLDGSSMTVYAAKTASGEIISGVCSRNLELKEDPNNTFWQVALRDKLVVTLEQTVSFLLDGKFQGIALQGELVGPGIQGNKYGLDRHEFFVYDIFAIGTQEYLLPSARKIVCDGLGFKHVPTLELYLNLHNADLNTAEDILKYAEGNSEIGNKSVREGVVFKSMNEHDVSFKAINNAWLIKNKE